MHQHKFSTIFIFILLSALLANCTPRPQSEAPEILSAIRNATILIGMQVPNLEHPEKNSLLQGAGIGSLVEFQGEVYLVTHNHWRETLADLTIVSFYDADNHLIKNIIGKQFREMIVHADPGTLVLRPPKELFEKQTPVHMDTGCSLIAGQTVDIVYRQTPERQNAAIEQAVIRQVLDYNGHSAYKLESLDGSVIQPGDSGGGVWQNGILAAVNWTTEQEVLSSGSTEPSSKDVVGYTGVSYAAVFTDQDR